MSFLATSSSSASEDAGGIDDGHRERQAYPGRVHQIASSAKRGHRRPGAITVALIEKHADRRVGEREALLHDRETAPTLARTGVSATRSLDENGVVGHHDGAGVDDALVPARADRCTLITFSTSRRKRDRRGLDVQERNPGTRRSTVGGATDSTIASNAKSTSTSSISPLERPRRRADAGDHRADPRREAGGDARSATAPYKRHHCRDHVQRVEEEVHIGVELFDARSCRRSSISSQRLTRAPRAARRSSSRSMSHTSPEPPTQKSTMHTARARLSTS